MVVYFGICDGPGLINKISTRNETYNIYLNWTYKQGRIRVLSVKDFPCRSSLEIYSPTRCYKWCVFKIFYWIYSKSVYGSFQRLSHAPS